MIPVTFISLADAMKRLPKINERDSKDIVVAIELDGRNGENSSKEPKILEFRSMLSGSGGIVESKFLWHLATPITVELFGDQDIAAQVGRLEDCADATNVSVFSLLMMDKSGEIDRVIETRYE